MAAKKSYDEPQIRLFLKHVLEPGYCCEIRSIGATLRGGNVIESQRYASNVGGYFDDVNSIVATVTHFDGVSPYVTCNPVKPDLLARISNRLKVLGKGEATKDEDIAFVRWIPIDIDPVRPDKISSTDAELGAAVELRDRILSENPVVAESSIWGKSGNGAWIWVRVPDLCNDEEDARDTYERVKAFIGYFADKYGDKKAGAKVIIDRKTCNASRIMAFAGVLKCKGEDHKDRPWRLATIDSGDREIRPLEIEDWEEEHLPTIEAPAVAPFVSPDDRDRRVRRAARYLASMPAAIAGQNGHDATFAAASALVHGFGLSRQEARPILDSWNAACSPPWESADLDRKLDQAETTPHTRPFGYLHDADDRADDNSEARAIGAETIRAMFGGGSPPPEAPPLPPQNGDDGVPAGQEANPHRLARLFLNQHYAHHEGHTLRFWRDEFFGWNGQAYEVIPGKEVRAAVSRVIAAEFERLWINAMIRHRMAQQLREQGGGEQGGGRPAAAEREPRLLPVSGSLVSDVVLAVTGIVLVAVANHPEQPAWLDEKNTWAPSEILPTGTGLVHMPSLAAGKDCMRRPTPRFFSTWACDYPFSEHAGEPTEWLKFLSVIWGDDQESIQLLQEWFGYCLTLDTSQQKILMVIGPMRAGKGTIASVLTSLLGGSRNVAGPTLSGLASGYGIAPLIGKPLAIVDDARLSGRADQAVITERLLTISGEGTITVDRKYLDSWTGKIPSRIMLLSNELPKLADSSGALPGRLLILRLKKSFHGKEDAGLSPRLLAEMPGILLWAIEGWKRLAERGRFISPASSESLKQSMAELSSPISEFVTEMCEVGNDAYEVSRSDVFNAWKTWNQCRGSDRVGDEGTFGRKLHSVVPALGSVRPRSDDGTRVRMYTGIRLKTKLELSFSDPDSGPDNDPQSIPISTPLNPRSVVI